MDDLISRQVAIDALMKPCKKCSFEHPDGCMACQYADIIEVIKDLPSAQPEIIYCKDCKHYQFADNRAFGMPVKMCEWFGFEDVDDDDFCSRAERLSDGSD